MAALQAAAQISGRMAEGMYRPSRPTLVDASISNHGARVRYIIYSKELEADIDIVGPKAFGGLKTDQYLALHPKGKMPVLVLPDGLSLPESEVISQYLCDKYSDRGPNFVPDTPEKRAKASSVARLHDMYFSSIQDAMYRPMTTEQRAEKISSINDMLDVFETVTEGLYVVGESVSTADAALFPSFVFMVYMLPSVFGWEDVFKGRPKLRSWWEAMKSDPSAKRVMDEMEVPLNAWKEGGRWENVGALEDVKNTEFQWAY